MAERGVGEYDNTSITSVKVEALPFDGRLDTKLILDWLSNIDDYFD